MHFTVATVLAFASSALAVGIVANGDFNKVNVPPTNAELTAGEPYVVKWEAPAPYSEGPIYIQLLGGKDPNTLTVKTEKLASLDNKEQQYTWNVDASLGDDPTYGLRFVWEKDDSIVQYSNPFHIKKADGSGSSTVTMTSSQGVKTVTLSSASSSTTSTTTTTTTTANTSTPVLTTSTASANTTTARNSTTHASTTLSRTTGRATESATQTTTPTTRPSSGAAAGSIAVVGGLVAALLAL